MTFGCNDGVSCFQGAIGSPGAPGRAGPPGPTVSQDIVFLFLIFTVLRVWWSFGGQLHQTSAKSWTEPSNYI